MLLIINSTIKVDHDRHLRDIIEILFLRPFDDPKKIEITRLTITINHLQKAKNYESATESSSPVTNWRLS